MSLSLRAWTQRGNVTTLTAELVGLFHRIERNRRVEVGEANDEEAKDDQIDRVGRIDQPFVYERTNRVTPTRGKNNRDQLRQIQHRRSEDNRDNTALVDLERDIGRSATVLFTTHDSFGERDGDAALTVLDEDDGYQHHDVQRHDDCDPAPATVVEDVNKLVGNGCHDRGEDDDGDAVTNTLLCDEFTHPHQQCSAGSKRENHETDSGCGKAWKQIETVAGLTRRSRTETVALAVEQEGEACRLHDRNGDREVTGPLGDLSLTNCALVLPLLDARNHDAKNLHNDRGSDVREDAESENRHLRQRATREERQEVEHAATFLLGTSSNCRDSIEVDARRRDERADAVDDDHRQGKENLVAKVRNAANIGDIP